VVVPDDGGDDKEYPITRRSRPLVNDGDAVEAGTQLISGAVNPHDVLRIMGPREVQLHLVREVQEVYRSQGVAIHDKHIEVIIRQMLRKRQVKEPGDTPFLPGQIVDRFTYQAANDAVRERIGTGGKVKYVDPVSGENVERNFKEATATWILLGITEASLAGQLQKEEDRRVEW